MEPGPGARARAVIWLAIRMHAPLMSFGAVSVDHLGPTHDFPGSSLLTGLVANALGWHWADGDRHRKLQDRLRFGARRECEGTVLTDVQNARLSGSDSGWTTGGRREGRRGSTYDTPHRRYRDYLSDLEVRVVLCLEPAAGAPTIDDISSALEFPARPLFLGRKPCVPAGPLLAPGVERWVEGATAWDALNALPGQGAFRATWPVGDGPSDPADGRVERVVDVPDLRNWSTGLHGGSRRMVEGRIALETG